MVVLDHSLTTLRFFGDDLVPESLSAALGALPTHAYAKGQQLTNPATGRVQIAKTGSWRLKANRRKPEALEAQIFELLSMLSNDMEVLKSLACYQPNLFCGLFMSSGNDMLPLSASALLALGQRGIALTLDIYNSDDEDN